MKTTIEKREQRSQQTHYWPDKVCDDEQLHDPVDDAHRPTLDHHRLGGLVGEEVSDAAPQHAHGCET